MTAFGIHEDILKRNWVFLEDAFLSEQEILKIISNLSINDNHLTEEDLYKIKQWCQETAMRSALLDSVINKRVWMNLDKDKEIVFDPNYFYELYSNSNDKVYPTDASDCCGYDLCDIDSLSELPY